MWQQCPIVQGRAVSVLRLYRHMQQYESEFPCPSCRTVFACDAVEMHDAWNADDALDALLEDDEDYDDAAAEDEGGGGASNDKVTERASLRRARDDRLVSSESSVGRLLHCTTTNTRPCARRATDATPRGGPRASAN